MIHTRKDEMDHWDEYLSQFPKMSEVKSGITYPLEDAHKYFRSNTNPEIRGPKEAMIQQHLRME